MMTITVAKNAGYCFGVKNAMDIVYKEADKRKLYTYGPIIHNKAALKELEEKGVFVIDDLDNALEGNIVIRTHGVGRNIYDKLEQLKSNNMDYIDATCPCVKKIHRIVLDYGDRGYQVAIIGDPKHPEIIGIKDWAGQNACVISSAEEAEKALFDLNMPLACVVQTTFHQPDFEKIVLILKGRYPGLEVENTICGATVSRQDEAVELAKDSDIMLIVGDKTSANTQKLYKLSQKYCERTYFIETILDLQLNIFTTNDKIGITAGASTSPATLKEVVTFMSEFEKQSMEAGDNSSESFEQMLEDSFVSLHTGEVVKGTVISVSQDEVSVNLGYKSDGIIPREELASDPGVSPMDLFKAGDEIEVFVVRVNDGEGNVLLSRKRLEAQKGMEDVEKAFEAKEIITGKVTEVVKGGLIAIYKGVRVFIPSSQVSNRYVEDLSVYKGSELNFKIIELDKSKRRIVGGRKEIAQLEENERKEKVYATLEIGQRVDGTVSRLVDFGAFVDIGGVDGLIHISEMSWGNIKSPKDILSEGQQVSVIVLDINKDKGKISLTLKDIKDDPWNKVGEKYVVGENVTGTVVRMVPFGAFIELEPGVDGLVHISQISNKHVVKPEDELKIGEQIVVRVTDVNMEQRKISLSKKEADAPAKQVEDAEAGSEAAQSETPAETSKVTEIAEKVVDSVKTGIEKSAEVTETVVEKAAEIKDTVKEKIEEALEKTEAVVEKIKDSLKDDDEE